MNGKVTDFSDYHAIDSRLPTQINEADIPWRWLIKITAEPDEEEYQRVQYDKAEARVDVEYLPPDAKASASNLAEMVALHQGTTVWTGKRLVQSAVSRGLVSKAVSVVYLPDYDGVEKDALRW